MEMNNAELISQLTKKNDELKNFTHSILEMPEGLWTKIPNTKGWSVLHCFDHMNKATELYLNQIEEKLGKIRIAKNSVYKKTFFAKMFTKQLAPTKEGLIRSKMKTLKPFFPQDNPDQKVIDRFLSNLNRYEHVLGQLENKNLRSFKVTTALGPILKFYLGDALDFVHAHNLRHAQQIKNILVDITGVDQKAA